MAGTITHYWEGTKLVVTSDSGTSSCDLKGAQGDIGVRGCQGAPGIGEKGSDGKSAYQTWLDAGNSGTEGDFLKSLKGEKGADGCVIVSTEFVGIDEEGGSIYEQTFSNGATARFTVPKGENGVSAVAYKVSAWINNNFYSTVIAIPGVMPPEDYSEQITCVVCLDDFAGNSYGFYLLVIRRGVGIAYHPYTGAAIQNVSVAFEPIG